MLEFYADETGNLWYVRVRTAYDPEYGLDAPIVIRNTVETHCLSSLLRL